PLLLGLFRVGIVARSVAIIWPWPKLTPAQPCKDLANKPLAIVGQPQPPLRLYQRLLANRAVECMEISAKPAGRDFLSQLRHLFGRWWLALVVEQLVIGLARCSQRHLLACAKIGVEILLRPGLPVARNNVSQPLETSAAASRANSDRDRDTVANLVA